MFDKIVPAEVEAAGDIGLVEQAAEVVVRRNRNRLTIAFAEEVVAVADRSLHTDSSVAAADLNMEKLVLGSCFGTVPAAAGGQTRLGSRTRETAGWHRMIDMTAEEVAGHIAWKSEAEADPQRHPCRTYCRRGRRWVLLVEMSRSRRTAEVVSHIAVAVGVVEVEAVHCSSTSRPSRRVVTTALERAAT